MSQQAHQRVARLVQHLQPNSVSHAQVAAVATSATAALGQTPRQFIKQEVRGASSENSSGIQLQCRKMCRRRSAAHGLLCICRLCCAGRVGVIWLNRPSALNALNDVLMAEVGAAIVEYEQSGVIGCIVLTGEGKAFAAGVSALASCARDRVLASDQHRGLLSVAASFSTSLSLVNTTATARARVPAVLLQADIKEMAGKSFFDMLTKDKIAPWEIVSKCKIPIIAAVNGFAFGGGCEIAMMCDILLASETAKFGQPEIKIGTMPGAGGTQRLTKAIGKSKAMEMCLTGNTVTAAELERAGLVSRVLPAAELMPAAMKLAEQIASMSLPLVKLTKASVLASFDTTLTTGMGVERALFQSTFALKDQKEGMDAFVNKRAPQWNHQ